MAIPAPGADETATALYGIRKPKASRLAKFIWQSIGRVGDDVEEALIQFGLPPVVSAQTVAAVSDAARDAHWGIPTTPATRLALQNFGATTIRTDTDSTQRYYAQLSDGGTNPGGRAIAGWYSLSAGAATAGTLAMAAGVVLASGSALVKDANGIVTLNLEASRASNFNTNGDVAALPVGFRPTVELTAPGAAFASGAYISVGVTKAGNISIYSPPSSTVIRFSVSFLVAP